MADSYIWCTQRVNSWDCCFFIIYINDLPGVVSAGNKIVLYADDSKLYKVIHSVHDQECFQQDLNKVNEWCVNNKMRINASKCKVMRITKKSSFTYHYHIDGTKLDSVFSAQRPGFVNK